MEVSKGRSRPIPDAVSVKNAAFKLEEALNNENQFICNYSERNPWEVTANDRDGAVHTMRFLNAWFDLPSRVFFTAVSYLDQFLARMKVQSKFLPCLSVSCFNVAAEKHRRKINTSQLVNLSHSKCSIKDMDRMSKIITQKLGPVEMRDTHTVFDLLEIYMDLFKCIADQLKTQVLLNRMLQWPQLSKRLEVVVASSSCAQYKASLLALAFIQYEMEAFLAQEIPKKPNCYSTQMFYMLALMIELQTICKIKSSDYSACLSSVGSVLGEYHKQHVSPHRQKMIWRFSISAPRYALSSFYSKLSTVEEE